LMIQSIEKIIQRGGLTSRANAYKNIEKQYIMRLK